MRWWSGTVLTLLTVILALAPTEARAESAEKLIRQAGNCEDDAQRLEILKQILKSADLDPTLRDRKSVV